MEYQQVEGINSRTIPKRVGFATTDAKSSLRTNDVMELVSIIPGPIDDREFSISEFQPKLLQVKQSQGWNYTTLLIGAGILLIVVAVVVRVVAERRSRAGK